LLRLSVSVSGDAIQGGWARGSASASYEQLVVIDGGTGAGLLTVVYWLSSCCFGDWYMDIAQGDQHWNYLTRQFTLSSAFTYGVPFRVASSGYVAASTGRVPGDTYAVNNINVQSLSVMADGKAVTLRVVNNPEPASFTLLGLGLYSLTRLRRRRCR
jgi:hypothetical protein